MLIRKFQEADVHAAGQMAYDTWSYELNGVGARFEPVYP